MKKGAMSAILFRMEQRKKTTFVRGAAILAAAGLLSKVLGVLFRIFAVRIIGEEGMYYYELVYPTYAWLLIISSSGIPTAISRMVAERVARGNYAAAHRVFRKALLLLAGIGLVTTALMFFGADWIGTVLLGADEGAKYSLMALSFALFFVSLLCAYRGYLQGLQRMEGTGISQIAEQIFKMLFGLILAAVLYGRYADTPFAAAAGSMGILIGVSLSELCALLVMMAFYRKACRGIRPLIKTEAEKEPVLGTLLSIAVPITLGASILPIANVLDSAMITRLLESTGYSVTEAQQRYVALCTYVRSVINLPASLTVSLSMSLVPAIAAAKEKRDERGVQQFTGLGLKLSMAIGLPCAVGLSVLARPLIKLLYSSIRPETLDIAAPLMQVAAFTVIFISLVQTATGGLQGIGKHRLPVWFLLIGGVTKVVVNYVCIRIPSINILGAVLSNLACYGIAGILDTVVLLVLTKTRLSVGGTFIKPILASVLMGAAAWGTHALLSALSAFQTGILASVATVLAVVVGIVVYAVLMLVLRTFTKEELAYIPGGRKLMRFAK